MREETTKEEKNYKNMKTSNKMTIIYLSIITLNFNELITPIKHRVADWIGKKKTKNKKQDSSIYCLQEIYFKDTHRLKVKGYKKIFHANANR